MTQNIRDIYLLYSLFDIFLLLFFSPDIKKLCITRFDFISIYFFPSFNCATFFSFLRKKKWQKIQKVKKKRFKTCFNKLLINGMNNKINFQGISRSFPSSPSPSPQISQYLSLTHIPLPTCHF